MESGGEVHSAEEDTSAFTIRVVTRVGDLTSAVAEHTRPENAAPWDPVGLQLGDLDASVEKVGVCHEVNEEVIESLERQRVDLLVTYHPLLFEPTNQLLAGQIGRASCRERV